MQVFIPNWPRTNGGSGFPILDSRAKQTRLWVVRDIPLSQRFIFLDGRIEPFTRLPSTRWQRLAERDALIVAAVLALVFAVLVELLGSLLQ